VNGTFWIENFQELLLLSYEKLNNRAFLFCLRIYSNVITL
jgi:hypothetical protein